jgi:hypothetical protein
LRKYGQPWVTVTLKIKFADFVIISRGQSLPEVVSNRAELDRIAMSLLGKTMPLPKAVRLLGGVNFCLADGPRRKPADRTFFLNSAYSPLFYHADDLRFG